MKRLEHALRRMLYAVLRLVIRNRDVSLPIAAHGVRKILILRYDRLGDMVVTTPMIELLHERLPNAELHVLASPRNAGLLAHDKRIARTFVWDGSWRDMLRVARLLRREKYDVMLCAVFFKMSYAGILANFFSGRTTLKCTLAHDNPRRAELYSLWFNAQVPVEYLERKQSMAEILVEMVCRTFGWAYTNADTRFRVVLAEAHRTTARTLLPNFTGSAVPRVLLNLSAGEPFREWSEANNRKFLTLLCERYRANNASLHLVFSAVGEKRREAERLQQDISSTFGVETFVLPSTHDVLQLCAFVERVDVVITPDTSITHIATAFGKPSVVLCTRLSSSPQWMPFGVPFVAVYPPVHLPEAPVEAIAPEAVVQAFSELLHRLKQP
jgi:ADP-heptose:LPS heptosyltransferase